MSGADTMRRGRSDEGCKSNERGRSDEGSLIPVHVRSEEVLSEGAQGAAESEQQQSASLRGCCL